MIEKYIFGIVVFVILISAATVVIYVERQSKRQISLPAYNHRRLMTSIEVLFYEKLRAALPELAIFPQVALSAIVDTIKQPGEITWRNKIANKVLDYVVCVPGSYEVIAIIELDDNTHKRPARVKADADKNAALNVAGHRLFRYEARQMPSPERIRADFSNAPSRT
ncbi:DUF2726 domain-containing protein [Sulfuritalea sp.]|uniref:DUF2726 domain-containing protein n=1 Tax=Sulfuritalea sp. TaxID=2480090 RepID=UPI00286DD9AE|nr:DUF2726 domain-containing protein [Sulfuritalea sp.]